MWREVHAACSINELLLSDWKVGEDAEAGHVNLREGRVRGSTSDIITTITSLLTRRTASSAAPEAMASISEEGLKVRDVTDVSRFITAFRGFGLAKFRHASWE